MNNFLQTVLLFSTLGFHATVAEEIVVYAQIGEDASLTLPSEYKSKYLFWYFDGKDIASINSAGGPRTEWGKRLNPSFKSLLIKNVTKTDFGIFKCTVKHQRTQVAEYSFRLIQLSVTVNHPVLLPGEQLSLTCDIESPDHRPQIHWLNPQGQREGTGGRPTVQATLHHSGQWTCVITNVQKETLVNVKVTVIDLFPPTPSRTLYTSAPNPLTIPCSLAADTTWDQVKSKGIHEVGWNFCPAKPQCDKSSLFQLSLENRKPTWKTLTDRALQSSLNLSRGDLSLARNRAREADSGDYECFVKFQNGVTLIRTVRVEVLRIVAAPGTKLKTGQQLNLTCTTGYTLPPDMQIHWFPPKEASSSSSSSSPSASPSAQDLGSPHFTIKGVGSDQNGTWRCELRRGETILTSAVVVLNIEPVFSAWVLVTLCAGAAILILLVILIVILQRRRQRRTRRHMRLCQCKNPKPKGFYRS